MHLNYEHYQNLLTTNPALRLLRKDTAALVLTFLHETFRGTAGRQTQYGARELATRLDDLLFALNGGGPNTPGALHTRPARAYLISGPTTDSCATSTTAAPAPAATKPPSN